MNRPLSIVFLVVGALLLIFGISASESFTSEVSRVFTGSPTDKAMWMMIGGAAALATGLFGLLRGSART